ncbi:cytochrome P450 [Sphingopyxis sp. GW247-27LB]|uniref:cytochrome P450 n=1 Tax=Sphingopyxis sp. GW247-27LB TaxID=2012632 RepID=UPI000BA5E8DF|nr:cytochrome P450 [Sphingopyxis sp. GW247-27LB]PAL22072.1 cytochrome [Sphingopyxis sp. GW247-27LB]
MTAAAAPVAAPPPHVPAHLVFDFDIYADPRIGEDVQGSYAAALEAAPDIFWTRLNGGHWIVKSFDAIARIVLDPEHFSVREMQIPRVENPPFFIPLSLDPPENLPYRKAMMPMFGPNAIKALEPRIREWAVELVDAVAANGACDFQADVSKLFPVSVFMELMGMDLSRLQDFRHLAEQFFSAQNDEAEMGRLSALILGEMKALIEAKKAAPDDKLMSHFIGVDIGGRTMSDDEILAMSFVLFLGGMDTVTNVTGFAFQQLAQMPEVQARLAADPSLIPAFADEAVRLYGVVNTPRLVVQDQVIGDAQFRAGEMLLNILCLGSRDPAKFERPNLFDLDRKKTAHLTFSSGPHLCVGHVLGRAELRILTEEWIRRIPSFRAVSGERHAFRIGTVMALETLPLEWPIAG